MKKFVLFSLLICVPVLNFGQNTWLTYTPDSAAVKNNGDSVNYSVGGGEVKIIQDERLDKIGAFLRTGEGTVEGVKIDGYRVLIFFDQDKSLAEQRKAAFMSAFPEHRTYVDYVAPNYRVRVGNFRSRLEAESLKADLIVEFTTALVVADKIDLPVLEPKVK